MSAVLVRITREASDQSGCAEAASIMGLSKGARVRPMSGGLRMRLCICEQAPQLFQPLLIFIWDSQVLLKRDPCSCMRL